MANLLDDYHQSVVKPADYVRLLRQYTKQHLLDGKPDLQEDYDPDTGKPIVGLDRSHHYNHSGYADLVITGLCGLRPRADDTLEVNPIVDGTMPHFLLENVPYHGHAVTIQWDADGKAYRRGRGLSVYVDGARRIGPRPLGRATCPLGKPLVTRGARLLDTAVNVPRQGYPRPSASSDPKSALWQAVDGRAWFFPEMVRGWTPKENGENWYAIDYGTPRVVGSVVLSLYKGGATRVPEGCSLQRWDGKAWRTFEEDEIRPGRRLLGNTSTVLTFFPELTSRLRVVFRHAAPMRLVEIETY